MAPAPADPYATLGLAPGASEEAVRTAYRRLAQLHHPDHNGGSHASAVRFAEIQEAYAHIRLQRRTASARANAEATGSRDPDLDARLAQMERELRVAREQREQAARHAAQAHAAATAQAKAEADATAAARASAQAAARAARTDASMTGSDARPSDADLGYITTDDSFTRILDDFADQVARNFAEARDLPRPPGPRRPRSVVDWIDELGSRLTGDKHKPDE
jgi:curved DNA-binding protein CbpA